MDSITMIDYGLIPNGEHEGKYIDQLSDTEILNFFPRIDRGKIGQYLRNAIEPLYQKIKRNQEIAYQKELEARKPVNEYYGKVGDVLKDLEVTVKTMFWIKMNGVWVIGFEGKEGHNFSAFYNGTVKFKKGETCKIEAIIRSHKEYRGMKQTGLSKIKKTS